MQILFPNGVWHERSPEIDWSYAVQTNDVQGVRSLLDQGFPVDSIVVEEHPSWQTALKLAIRHEETAMAEVLLHARANVDHKDAMWITPLMSAAFVGRPSLVEQLLTKGALIDAQSVTGLTALHWAARQGDEAIVQRLLRAGADWNLRDHQGKTAMDMAMDLPVHPPARQAHLAAADRIVMWERSMLEAALLTSMSTPLLEGPPRRRL